MSYISKRESSEEIDLNFFIRTFEVVDNTPGRYYGYRKIHVVVKDAKNGQINHEQVLPEELTVKSLLRNIEKLYNVYMYTQNKKLAEGAREEMLKLIALLIWKLW